MSTPLDFKYRIIYEALSRLSGTLSRSATLDDVRQCLQRQLKYIFDYQLTRFCFYQQDYHIVFSLSPAGSLVQTGAGGLLWKTEIEQRLRPVPTISNHIGESDDCLNTLPFTLPDLPTERWSWHTSFSVDSGMIVSVYSGADRRFNPSDVPTLRVVLETLYGRLLSIRLIEELGQRRHEIEQTLLDLQDRNRTIARLVDSQETIIQLRTRELEQKNAKLLAFSRQHTHTIREPLSRILSLAYLADVLSPEEVVDEIIPSLATTAADLDKALQQVIQEIDREFDFPD
ncbi:hypothetical protein GCM10027578_26660 [Spirosoma luteolum]